MKPYKGCDIYRNEKLLWKKSQLLEETQALKMCPFQKSCNRSITTIMKKYFLQNYCYEKERCFLFMNDRMSPFTNKSIYEEMFLFTK